MQQYRYKKKFPFNNTIKETNREDLEDDKSQMTFTSIRHRKNYQFQKGENLGVTMQHELEGQANNNFFDMKSETVIRNFGNDNSPARMQYDGVAFLQRNSAFAGGSSERIISITGSQSVNFRDFYFQILNKFLWNFLIISLNPGFQREYQPESHIRQSWEWTRGWSLFQGFPKRLKKSLHRSVEQNLGLFKQFWNLSNLFLIFIQWPIFLKIHKLLEN